MEIAVRTPAQAGAAIRRIREQRSLTQSQLGAQMRARQATVSKLESGEPATELRTLMHALAALELELVIRPRTSTADDDLEALFGWLAERRSRERSRST